MRSSFFEFNVAASALFTARAGLDTVSHNVANASAAGYSRQYVKQRAAQPMPLNNGRGMIGTGSEVYGIGQWRDIYLDGKYREKTSVLGEYSAKSTQLALIERVMGEMSDTGLSAAITDFFNELKNLETSANDSTFRANALELGDSFAAAARTSYETLLKQQSDLNAEVKAVVTVINDIGQRIANLNDQIFRYEIRGDAANDLRDERARLTDELSRYVNIEAAETESSEGGTTVRRYTVSINGHEFVRGSQAETLGVAERRATDANGDAVSVYRNPEDNPGLYDVVWAATGEIMDVYHPNLTGELRGLIDARDGNNDDAIKGAAAVSYDDTTGELVVSLPAGARRDVNPAGGVIAVYDPSTGRVTEYEYTSFTYNADGSTATLTIANPSPNDLFTRAGVSMSVGVTTDYKGVPYYLDQLNSLVRTFATAVNYGQRLDGSAIPGVIGHADGYDLTGRNTASPLFTYLENGAAVSAANYDIYRMTAANFAVNPEIKANPALLAAASEATGGVSDNRVVLSFANIASDGSLFREGNIRDYIIGISSTLGTDAKQADNFAASYGDITSAIDNQRAAVSGVDINEEMVSMIKYQQQYQAAAKLINIIDGIYDLTINQLGV
ncbi:MAG: flagellar hook-associated protein FlgK [Clostridiales bacterium]|jgi:flagellar hook-associated protein 1 FlgK|nr:flagellar hook-associated protein FlgK [Clostridiales bacterium]